MGPNPELWAGRANFAGLPTLYLSEHAETAIAEIRVSTGPISVCECITQKDLQLVDFTAQRDWRTSLERCGDFSALEKAMIESLGLNEVFSRKLGPLIGSDMGYRLTQTISHACREIGYNGIRYTSSLEPPRANVALFDPNLVRLGNVQLYNHP